VETKLKRRSSEILAVIPARGGSKGLTRKNIRLLNGIPLIGYSIAAAQHSHLTTRVICSTDSEEISEIARELGAEIPFLRPKELAEDYSTDFDVFSHLLKWLAQNESYKPDIVVQLRPTSPIRPVGFVDEGIEKLLSDPSSDSLRTVCPAPNTPFKMWLIDDKNDVLTPLLRLDGVHEPYNAPRQDLPEVWWQAGLLDVFRAKTVTDKRSMSGDKISYIKIKSDYAIDIDNLDDFNMAEKSILRLECIRP
jgi:N-acylneuraminate cytidylyltransferase